MDTLESGEASPANDARIVAIWRGNDAAERDRIKEALESADVPFTSPDPKSYFSFLPTEPTMEIWISEADQQRARKLLLDLEGRVDPDDLTPEEIEKFALPESDDDDQNEAVSVPSNAPEDWDDPAHVSEVWKGNEEDLANNLMACFREIGIPSQKLAEESHWRLVVPLDQEARAKEIVREVVEAAPPA